MKLRECLTLPMQGKTVESFDHVQRGLVLDDGGEAEEGGASVLRNVTDDMKRALGALQVRRACMGCAFMYCALPVV